MSVDSILKIITLTVSVLTLCGFGVMTKLFWEDRHRKKLERTEENKQKKKIERQAEIKEVLAPLEQEMGAIRSDLKDTKDGIQAELKHDIRNACRRCIQQGYKTLEDFEEVTSMHENYEKLGSNGKTNALYEEFGKLPMKPRDEHMPEKTKTKGGRR